MIGLAIEAISTDPFDPIDIVAALLFPFPFGKNVRSHALSIEILSLTKIADVKLNFPGLI